MIDRILNLTIVTTLLMAGWSTPVSASSTQAVKLDGNSGGKLFEGIGAVNGGGATSVLLKDYPEPQRSQILDMVYKPMFGASVSTLLVEIPGDGNSTQGSMPSHMHIENDLNYSRGYTWWMLSEAKERNPDLLLDAAAWSAPGWIGNGKFWSQDAADYYVKWLEGLRKVHGLELDAIGCRNEKGVDYDFVKRLRKTLDHNGFKKVRIHAFDNWPDSKLDFVKDLLEDRDLRDSIDIIGAHIFYGDTGHASKEVQEMAAKMGKPIWNTEDHVYLPGFACAIGIVECFNDNFLKSGATRIVNWYDIGGVYPMEPYPEEPPMILAHWPWSGHYKVRENLWGYAHYGQFCAVGWEYLNGGCGELDAGGSYVTLKSPKNDYSIIIETKDAKEPQQLRFQVGDGLSCNDLCVWRSNAQEQFVEQEPIKPQNGSFTITLDPESIYSVSTTRGQQKGSFENIPEAKPFPFPYYETYESYVDPAEWGYLSRYLADIEEVFEIVERQDGKGMCIQQVCPIWPISWAPSWQPYTIIGDQDWHDYEISVDVCLHRDDSAGVMGRVNHVGTGYGTIPKGYFLQLHDNGKCELIVVRGKKDKKKLVGDAEQQAQINKSKDDSEGGEKVLASVNLDPAKPGEWHNLMLRLEGSSITALVDGKAVMTVEDDLYEHGMGGLLAGKGEGKKLSTPYYDNLMIKAVGAQEPEDTQSMRRQTPLYTNIPVAH